MSIQQRKATKAVREVFAVLLILLLAISATSAVAQHIENTYSAKHRDENWQANTDTVTIIASSTASTYTRIAEDIQNVLDDVDPNGLRVVPILGRGGGQNFHDILFLRGVDIGTTDADYMRYFKQKDPLLYGNADQYVQYITKLFNVEFHVLARTDIGSYSDLSGKKVNFWKPLSITAMAAENIFRALGIDVIPTNFDNDLAIEKLRTGEISAVVRMSGAPHNDYVGVKPADAFHLVPLTDANLPKDKLSQLMELYLPTALRHEQYPQLIPEGQLVPTVAGSVVLAVYAWPEGSNDYQRIANFVKVFFDNIKKFSSPARHPKWREVNLAATVPGWRRFKAAQEWLDRKALESAAGTQIGHDSNISQDDREKLFKAFTEWRNKTRQPANADAGIGRQ